MSSYETHVIVRSTGHAYNGPKGNEGRHEQRNVLAAESGTDVHPTLTLMATTVAERLEAVLPDASVRQAMLTIFAESMGHIRSHKSEWCLIRFHGKHLRLFAGHLIVLTLERSSIWVTTDPSAHSVDLSQLRSWRWDEKSYPRYERPASRNGYYDPSVDNGGDWLLIRDSHFSYLDRVLAEGRGPDSRTAARHENLVAEHVETVVSGRFVVSHAMLGSTFDPQCLIDERNRSLAFIVRRQGQSTFRQALLRAYDSRCAFTGCRIPQVLDAAHIVPYQGQQTDHVQNGLLLRTDLHTLLDLGLLAVDSGTLTILVSHALAGSEYAELDGKRMHVPADRRQYPSPAALDEHRSRSNLALKPAVKC